MIKHKFTTLIASLFCATINLLPSVAQPIQTSVNLVSNGDFQADANADGTPDTWGAPKGPLAYETENDNRFARLSSEKPGQTAMLYRIIPVPDDARALELSWKQRISNLKPGKQAWFDARIMMEWKDAEGKKVKGAPSAPHARKDTDGWVERSIKFMVPEGAKQLEFMPALFQVQTGTLDLDDIVLKPVDPAPVEEAHQARVAAQAERNAAATAKRQANAAKNSGLNGELFPNGDFQTVGKITGVPDKWGAAKAPVSWETEGDNRFLRLTAPEPGKTVMYYRLIDIPADVKAVELKWKQRVTDLKPGKSAWFDARIMMDFKDAANQKVAGGPSAPYSRQSSDGWVERSIQFLVPEGAVALEFMPSLFQVERGTFDLDDLSLKPVAAATLTAARAKAADDAKKINLPYEKPDPSKFPSALRVVGNKILNQEGKEVWLQGLNVMSLDWSPTGERVLLTTKVALEEWKANLIRLPVKEHYWFGTDASQKDGGKAYRELVDAVINMTANRGAYVLLDLHRYRAPKKEHADFWKDAATRYKDHPALIFDLFNEPHGTSWEVWRNGGFVAEKKEGVDETAFLSEEEKIANNVGFRSVGMQGLLDAVRSTGAKNVVLAGGLDYGYDLSGIAKGFALDDKGGNGIIYGSHIYPWKKGYQDKVLVIADKYPILSGENGGNTKKISFIPKNQQEDTAIWVPRFLGMVQKYKLHWAGFSFHPKASPVLISDWDYTPTPEWGALAKRALAGEKFPDKGLR
jgi:hypothetical protein